MSSATSPAPANPFTGVYNPANAVEHMMVDQIAMSWQRLQRATDAEKRYFDKNDILEVLNKKPAEYKAIIRYVSDCERAWHRAIVHLERMQRQRLHPRPSKPAAVPKPVQPPPNSAQDSVRRDSVSVTALPIAARAG